MDNILSGLIPGLIGAIATLAAAFITRSYTEIRVRNARPSGPLDSFTAMLLQTFTAIAIRDAKRFAVKVGEAYVDPHVDLSIGLTFADSSGAYINLAVPGQEAEEDSTLEPGWTNTFDSGQQRYRLTLVKLEDGRCTFDLRQLRNEPR